MFCINKCKRPVYTVCHHDMALLTHFYCIVVLPEQCEIKLSSVLMLSGTKRLNSGLLIDAHVRDVLSQPQGDLGNSTDGVRLQLANALFVQSGVKLMPEFTQHALEWGNSSLLRVNFSNSNHTYTQLHQWERYQNKGEPGFRIKVSAKIKAK